MQSSKKHLEKPIFVYNRKNIVAVEWRGEDLQFDPYSAGRKIFFNSDVYLKIDHEPKDDWHFLQTAREIEFWETLREDKQYFAQILDYGRTPCGKYWLLQKSYTPDTPHICTSENFQILGDLIWKYSLRDVWADDRDGSGNWMLSGGEVIIYDWAGYKA